MGSNSLVDRLEDLGDIFLSGEHALGNDLSCHLGDLLLVGLVNLHPGVHEAGVFTFEDGGAGTEAGDKGQQEPYGGMEPAELLVADEGQVDMHTLHIAPPVATAVEDLVVKGIDAAVMVLP